MKKFINECYKKLENSIYFKFINLFNYVVYLLGYRTSIIIWMKKLIFNLKIIILILKIIN